MKTKVIAIKVIRPDGEGFNRIRMQMPNGDLKRRFLERLLEDGVVVPQPAVVVLLREVLLENRRLREALRLAEEARDMEETEFSSGILDVHEEELDEEGKVPDYYGA